MFLYHGTSGERLKKILAEGWIRPRGDSAGNFGHTVESCPHAIYLTDAYPLYFAVQAIEDNDPKPWEAVVIEIDTDMINHDHFNADEDVLEQIGRKKDGLPSSWGIEQRVQYYRDRLPEQQWSWEDSLKVMGTCCYLNAIPVGAITRIAAVDVLANPYVAHYAMNATISIPNYRFCAKEYRALTRWLFGDDDETDIPEDVGHGFTSYRWPPSPHRNGIRVFSPENVD